MPGSLGVPLRLPDRLLDWRRLADAALEVSVVGSFSRLGYDARRALGPWDDLDGVSLAGRTVMVTGATSGLGLATATRLATMGASVRIVGRDPGRTDRARDAIAAAAVGADVASYLADLADLDQVAALADAVVARESRLDALVHNAGALLATRTWSPQGHEVTFASMVLAPALLTERLVPLMAQGVDPGADPPSPARVVLVSSGGMYTRRLDVVDPESEGGYRGSTAYAKAKRAQVVLARRWADRYRDRGVVVHAMHPGWAATPGVHASLPTFERVMGPLLRTPDQGADTIVWLVAADEPAHSTGGFWLDRRRRGTHYVPGTRETEADRDALDALVSEALAPYLGRDPGPGRPTDPSPAPD